MLLDRFPECRSKQSVTGPGSAIFWKPADGGAGLVSAERSRADLTAPAAALGAIVLLTVFAGPVSDWTAATARQVFAADRYVAAVLSSEAGR